MTENKPLVSVIIPCYNSEKYVEQAVRSIMNQTYKDLEILITDDCSTDSSFVILQRLAEEDSRIKLFKNEQNQKIVRTLNALVERATGKYIARMDADDISLPKRIEKQVAFMETNPDYAMCGTNAWHIDENSKVRGKSFIPFCHEDCKKSLKYFSVFYHPTVMIKSSILKTNPYSESFLYAEDYELWIRLMYSCNLKCTNLKEKLFKYRIFRNQSSNINSKNQIESVRKIFSSYNLQKAEETHLNIFFYAQTVDARLERKHIISILQNISKSPFCLKAKIYEKIISYMLHTRNLVLKVIINPMFAVTLLLHFLRII